MFKWCELLFKKPKKQDTDNKSNILKLLENHNIPHIIDGKNTIWVENVSGQWDICPNNFSQFGENQ